MKHLPFVPEKQNAAMRHSDDTQSDQLAGGLKPSGALEPEPKKNFSISDSKNLRAFGSTGVNRYSFINIVW
jgi:hypothetical protein